MAYRRTHRVEKKLADKRSRILRAARARLAEGGFRAAQIADVAAEAGLATGTVYRYFESKSALFAEIFRETAARERAVMAEIADGPGSPADRLARAIEAYARRAVLGRRMAWALIAEPVEPQIEAARWELRAAYRDILERIISDGIATGEFPEQDARVAAASVVGAMIEPLIGPLCAPSADSPEQVEELVAATVRFCIAGITTPGGGASSC